MRFVVTSPDSTSTYELPQSVNAVTATHHHAVLQSTISGSAPETAFLTLLYRRVASDEALITVQESSGQIGIQVADGVGSLLEVDLCVDENECSPGVRLVINDRPDGLFPQTGDDVVRDWPLTLLAAD